MFEISQRQANYLTHKSRFSDSSLYDEVCAVCGACDLTLGEDQLTAYSCDQFKAIKEEYSNGRP